MEFGRGTYLLAICCLLGAALVVGPSAVGGAAPAAPDGTTADSATAHGSAAATSVGAVDVAGEGSTVEVVVRFEEPESVPSVAERKSVAERRQSAFLQWADARAGVTVERTFWISSAALVEVDTDEVPLQSLLNRPYVEATHENVEFTAASATASPGTAAVGAASGGSVTYGIDQLNVTGVWSDYGATGEGQTVAVLDTGVYVGHESIDLHTENSSDPTYPGGWAEFDDYGNAVEGSVPHDDGGHGTHVSGTVAGDAPDDRAEIGVAPNATLLHAKVLDGGSGSWSAVTAGLEWAVEEDADVASMSLGSPTTTYQLDGVEHARDHGVVVVAASGNDGEGTANSPGSMWSAIGVGATNWTEGVASFSSGQQLFRSDWSSPPTYWPDSWFSPTISAPGSDVESAGTSASDAYTPKSGTSMATPHVAGAIAVIQDATIEHHPPGEIRDALVESAWKPDDWDESSAAAAEGGADSRYGYGIVDVYDAIGSLQASDGAAVADFGFEHEPVVGNEATLSVTLENTNASAETLNVTVYADGEPVHNATETVDTGTENVTYGLTFEEAGDHTVGVNERPDETVTVHRLFDAPADGEHRNDSTIPFEVTAPPGENVTNATLHVDGGSHSVSYDAGSWSIGLNLTEGTYAPEVVLETDAGRTLNDSIDLTVDRTPPAIELNTPTASDPATASPGGEVVGDLDPSVYDDTNLETVELALEDENGTALGRDATSDPSTNFSVPVPETYVYQDEQTLNLSYVATDRAGNVYEAVEADAVVVELSPPNVTSVGFEAGYAQPNATIGIDVDVEYYGAIESVTANGTTLSAAGDGQYEGELDTGTEHGRSYHPNVTVHSADDHTVTANAVNTTYVLDAVAPTVDSVALPDEATAGSEYDASVAAGDGLAGVATVTVDGAQLSDAGGQWTGSPTAPDESGEYVLDVVVLDAAGNANATNATLSVTASSGGFAGFGAPSDDGGDVGAESESDDTEQSSVFRPAGVASATDGDDAVATVAPVELYVDEDGRPIGVVYGSGDARFGSPGCAPLANDCDVPDVGETDA